MAIHGKILLSVAFLLSAVLLLATSHRSNLLSSRGGPGTPDKARYIFMDVGANSADSLEVFLKHKDAKFDFDFPRPEWATYDQAEIYLFEANPYFNTALVEAKQRYNALGIMVNIFPSTVVDIKDGTRTFFLDTVNTKNDFWGSSVYATHPDVVSSHSNGTELSAINFSRWLLMNTLPRDFVVIKMDIEGSEFEIIPHMADMNVSTVVDYLLVEWHPVDRNGGTPEEIASSQARVKAAEGKLKAGGVNMPHYDSWS